MREHCRSSSGEPRYGGDFRAPSWFYRATTVDQEKVESDLDYLAGGGYEDPARNVVGNVMENRRGFLDPSGMRCWWANHIPWGVNQEPEPRYVWAPKRHHTGRRLRSLINVRSVSQGDVLSSLHQRRNPCARAGEGERLGRRTAVWPPSAGRGRIRRAGKAVASCRSHSARGSPQRTACRPERWALQQSVRSQPWLRLPVAERPRRPNPMALRRALA